MRALTVYFSHSGNTREIASRIREEVGGDIVEIQPVKPYPEDYDTVLQQAKRELNSGFKPPLKRGIEHVEGYDFIFVGSPNWWSTIAPPVRTFLAEHDLSGKTIMPFVTQGGGGSGRSFEEVAASCPGATVREGLAVLGGHGRHHQAEASAWLAKLGIVS